MQYFPGKVLALFRKTCRAFSGAVQGLLPKALPEEWPTLPASWHKEKIFCAKPCIRPENPYICLQMKSGAYVLEIIMAFPFSPAFGGGGCGGRRGYPFRNLGGRAEVCGA